MTATPIHEDTALLTAALKTLVSGQELSFDTMTRVMQSIMAGHCPDGLLAGLLVALASKGESIDEIHAGASVLRQLTASIDTKALDATHLVDIVGTGGDGANLFNISTASALVMASAGATVAKHGNTGVSTHSGASDVLAVAGVNKHLDSQALVEALQKYRFAFLFAPNHHSAMRHAKAVRSQLKLRTIFNILGPLSNPAFAPNALLGAYSGALSLQLCQVMQQLGAKHVLAVHSDDGLDEISLAAPTQVSELRNGQIQQYTIAPEDFAIARQSLDGLVVTDSQHSFAIIKQALSGASDDPIIQKAQAIIALNAGAGIYAANVQPSLALGIQHARRVLNDGSAFLLLQNYAAFSQSFKSTL